MDGKWLSQNSWTYVLTSSRLAFFFFLLGVFGFPGSQISGELAFRSKSFPSAPGDRIGRKRPRCALSGTVGAIALMSTALWSWWCLARGQTPPPHPSPPLCYTCTLVDIGYCEAWHYVLNITVWLCNQATRNHASSPIFTIQHASHLSVACLAQRLHNR